MPPESPAGREQVPLDGTWELCGWRQNDWELARTVERAKVEQPDVGPVAVAVPGSVRGALVRAGLVPDPMVGTGSRASEWIENRDWQFTTTLPDGLASRCQDDQRVVLHFDALDGPAVVLIDGEVVGRLANSFVPHRFDITDHVRAGASHLAVIFTKGPDGLGQNGWTSRIRSWKPRFYYGWDWTPRIVQIAVADPVRLEIGPRSALTGCTVQTVYKRGSAQVVVRLPDCAAGAAASTITVSDAAGTVLAQAHGSAPGRSGDLEVVVDVPEVMPWHVRPATAQALSVVRVVLKGAHDEVLDVVERRVGFREVDWLPTEDAPARADPWRCVVNGADVFLFGINWVPIRPDFADVPDEEYRARLQQYRAMGVTLLRVWGGAGAERDLFYDLCDELGLLVWQELPLSSSGLDNRPPDDAGFAGELALVAQSYATRLAHHPCVVMWGGGNELTDVAAPAVPGTPLTEDHPALKAAGATLRRMLRRPRYVATSPSGPRFEADPGEVGRGLHHDVHGPWEFEGDLDAWRRYWAEDDAVMRSEVGVAGASDVELLTRMGLWDPQDRAALRRLWTHSSGWWLKRFDQADPGLPLGDWVVGSARRQADMLGHAAAATAARHPRCGGFLVWLGHDTFPCAVSLSLLDWSGAPKPAARTLQALFADHPRCTSDPRAGAITTATAQ